MVVIGNGSNREWSEVCLFPCFGTIRKIQFWSVKPGERYSKKSVRPGIIIEDMLGPGIIGIQLNQFRNNSGMIGIIMPSRDYYY